MGWSNPATHRRRRELLQSAAVGLVFGSAVKRSAELLLGLPWMWWFPFAMAAILLVGWLLPMRFWRPDRPAARTATR